MNTSERKNYATYSVNADTRPLENAIINLKQELRNMNRAKIDSNKSLLDSCDVEFDNN